MPSAGCGFRKETVAGTRGKEREAPIPDARKGGVRVAPIADLRRAEYITVMCRKPTISKLSFVRAVIAER
jgi:hypothetical protein